MNEAPMSPTYAAFTEDEHRHRLSRAREILKRNGIACCISVAPKHLYYFAGHDSWVNVNSPQALIFMEDGAEPTLIVRDVDLALPRETSWVADKPRKYQRAPGTAPWCHFRTLFDWAMAEA
jgi:Xaa-Pro aminopeptidase